MAKQKKKSMTIRLGNDATTVLDVVKQAISKNDFGYIDSQAQFIEILIMNYAYQVLNDVDTFTKRQSMVKQALSDKEIEIYKYVDVTTPNGYGCVRLDNNINELEQKLEKDQTLLKEVDDALERKGKRLREIKEEIEELERQKTELESDNYAKGINNTSNQNIAKNRAGNNATSDIFDNKNRNGKEKNSRGKYHMKDKPRKERKDKVKAPQVEVINLVKGNDTLVSIDRNSFEQYILNYAKNVDGMTDEECKKYLNSLDYKGNDDKLKVSVNVFLELENMASEYADERVQLVSKASNYVDEIEKTKTEKDGIVFADIEVKANERIRKFEEEKRRKQEEFERRIEERKKRYNDSQSDTTSTTPTYEQPAPAPVESEGEMTLEEIIYNNEIDNAISYKEAVEKETPKISEHLYYPFIDIVFYDDYGEIVMTKKLREMLRKDKKYKELDEIIIYDDENEQVDEITDELAERLLIQIGRQFYDNDDDFIEVMKGQLRIMDETKIIQYMKGMLYQIVDNKIPVIEIDV